VGSLDARHFVPSDLPLLASYAVAVCHERNANEHLRAEGHVVNDGTKLSPWVIVAEKANRAMMALSTRLRLSPQSRARTKVKPARISAYERMRMEEEGDGGDD
jgi:phage terminase small subunit